MPLPTIPSGNVFSSLPTGYTVANSCRFNDGDSPQLEMDMGDNPTLETKYSFSCWLKLGQLGTNRCILGEGVGLTAQGDFRIGTDDKLAISERLASEARYDITTTRVFRDVGAWYNIILIFDSTQSTASDRVKIYVNGVRETAFDGTPTYPAEDADSQMNQGGALMQVGCQHVHDGSFRNFMDGYMAEVVFIDGTAYAHTDFGEFDEDSPNIWKPKDVSSLTFGANGYYLDFEDSSNLGNDANGGTDFTETNLAATDQMIDTPTNNFPVINVLNNMASTQMVITEGNLHKSTQTSKYWDSVYGTMGASSGKWYYEMKITNVNSGDVGNMFIGIVDVDQMDNATSGHYKFVNQSRGYGYFGQNGNKDNNSSSSSFGGTWGAVDDIVGCAFDLDNLKIYFSKDGTLQNSGDPTSGATGTGSAYDLASGYTYLPAIGVHYGDDHFDLNFGSPINTISSGNADGNGYGNFEYAVPSGYYALCTKNLAEYG